MRRAITVVALALVALGGSTVATVGHNEDCDRNLRAAAIETVPTPPGWNTTTLRITAGGWNGYFDDTPADSYESVFLYLQCDFAAAGLLARMQEVREAAGDIATLAVRQIGDETVAYRDGEDSVIDWRKGDVIGEMRIAANADFGAWEDYALAVTALLP